MFKKIFCSIILFASTVSFSQSSEGFWDSIRTTNETITLKSNERQFIKSADFPQGTSEIVYRITLLDDNQKISSSLVSVLKAIPDPTGISQGSAGAIFLLSTIVGEDKCKYAIFSNKADAENYVKTENVTKACLVHNEPTNKDAKLLKNNTKCFSDQTQNLFFGFSSKNWMMNEKVTLEIVPWISNNALKGWNTKTKKEIIALANSQKESKLLLKKDYFAAVFLEIISQKFKYYEFKQLLNEEKQKEIDAAVEQSLLKTGQNILVIDAIRNEVHKNFDSNNFEEAIVTLKSKIIEKGLANVLDYNSLAECYLFTKQYEKAFQTLQQAVQLDNAELKTQLNFAHLYMYTDRVGEAKEIHEKFKNQNITVQKSWKQQVIDDFKKFKQNNFSTDNFKKINRILD